MGKRQAGRRKYHYIYRTTCKITGKYYIGMHSTDNLEDGYLGSGKLLWYSIRKHGKDKHEAKILEFLPTRKKLADREYQLITEELIEDKMCMNISSGGTGFTTEQAKHAAKKSLETCNSLRKTDPEWAKNVSLKQSASLKKQYESGSRRGGKWGKDWTGKKLTNEHKSKIGKANSKKQSGSKNSQYGTCWINLNGISKKIKKEKLDDALSEGWFRGRKINNS